MAASPIPETAQRPDWPRLVARKARDHDFRIAALELGGGGTGTVTSVALSMPAVFSITGSPITTAGTLAVTWASQLQNRVLASPDGAAGSPTFRKLLLADFPTQADATILGNNTGGASVPLAMTAAQTRTLLNVADGATANVGTVTSVSGAGAVSGLTLTGTVTGSGSLTLGGTLSITSASVSDFNSATRAQTEAELVAGANITITPSGAGATRQLTIAASGGGAGLGGTATVTVPNGRIEWEETVAATGVSGTSKIIAVLAPGSDSDENTADMLPPMTLAGAPGTNTITFSMAFLEPVAGPIKLNWSAL